MKKLLILFALLLSNGLVKAQEPATFEADMWVMAVEADTVTLEFRRVVLGHNKTDFCINTGITRCYQLQTSLPTTEDFLGTMTSVLGDTYFLRIAHTDQGMIIWITNMDGQFPHFVISTNEPKRY